MASDAPPWSRLLTDLRGDTGVRRWREAARRLRDEPAARAEYARRRATLAVLASHTTDFLVELLPVAALSCGVDLDVHQGAYGQLEGELLDPVGALRAAAPDYLLLCGTEEDLQLGAGRTDDVVDAAVRRWTQLWDQAGDLGATVVQCTFPVPVDDAYGQAARANADSDSTVVARVNSRLADAGRDRVLFVDCDRLAAEVGLRVWRDERHLDVLRQPVSMEALPWLARAVAGVVAADVGLSRRCVVVDLDDTLWGGVIGEDGVAGVVVGGDAAGAPFARFQRYLLALRRRGIVLAVASKNDRALVDQALASVPGMVLRREDFATVVADWRPKSDQLVDIAERLGLGPHSLLFVDDNPAECAQVAAQLPDVDVVALPKDPGRYVRALGGRPTLEPGRLNADDLARADSYTARAQAEDLRVSAASLGTFLDDLRMRVRVRPLGPADLDRAAQLTQKTNQFNLTGRRYHRERLAELAMDAGWRCLVLSLADRFADHGTVGLLLLRLDGDEADIDTLLLSCRIIGRTAERRLVVLAADAARAAGCTHLVGTYVPTDRNGPAAGTYPDLGFTATAGDEGTRRFVYALDAGGPADTPHLGEETL